MARYLGLVSGRARTDTTRLGNASSGLRTECRGWDIGVNVYASPDPQDRDTFAIFMTGGSNGGTGLAPIGLVRLENGVPTFFPVDNRAEPWT